MSRVPSFFQSWPIWIFETPILRPLTVVGADRECQLAPARCCLETTGYEWERRVARGNLLPGLYFVLTAIELSRQSAASRCILEAVEAGGGHHESDSRQGAETRTSSHLGGRHGIGAEPSAGSGSRKDATTIRKAAGLAGHSCAAAGYGQSEKLQGRRRRHRQSQRRQGRQLLLARA